MAGRKLGHVHQDSIQYVFCLLPNPRLKLTIPFQVVFERLNDCLNETIVYSDDAIRPVFLIMF